MERIVYRGADSKLNSSLVQWHGYRATNDA